MRFLVCAFFAIALIVAAFHFAKPLPGTNFDESFLPKASSVKYIAAGNDAAAAGLFWIKGLTELGESFLTGKEYAYLGHVANLSTGLDSLFYTPYYFVGGVTPIDAKDTSDFEVLRRASRVYPERWRTSLYYALRLARGPYPDRAAAAKVMRKYFDSPDTTIPAHIRTIYRSFELDTMQTEMALETVLNDVMQPRFKKFRKSFCTKTYKLLGYSGLLTDSLNAKVYKEIEMSLDMLAEGKAHPQAVYMHLLQMKKAEPDSAAVQVANAAQDSAAVQTTDSTAAQMANAIQDSAAVQTTDSAAIQ